MTGIVNHNLTRFLSATPESRLKPCSRLSLMVFKTQGMEEPRGSCSPWVMDLANF